MAKHISAPSETDDLRRLFLWIGCSVLIHIVILIVTSLPYIMRGFRPAGATVAVPATTVTTQVAPQSAEKQASEAANTEKPSVSTTSSKTKPAAPPKATTPDPDATYFQDDKLTPADLRKGPDLDTGLDAK